MPMYTEAVSFAEPSYGVGAPMDSDVGNPLDWGSARNSVDISGEGDVQLGPIGFGANLSVDAWAAIVMFVALAGLWVLGGVIFRRFDVF